MDELEPLRRALDDAPDEAALRRVQAAVRARRAPRAEPGPTARRALFGAVLVAAAALFVVRARTPQPLRLADGASVPESFPAPSARDIRFADGSHVHLAGGSTLLKNGHVRIDLVASRLSERTRLKIELFGTLVFLFPFALLMLRHAWPFFMDAVANREVSINAGGLWVAPVVT